MAISSISHFCVLLPCLACIVTATGWSEEFRRANNELELDLGRRASSSSPGQHALLARSGAGGRELGSGDGLLKYSIFDYDRFLLDTIRNPFNRKRVFEQGPSKAEHDHNVLFIFGDSLFDAGNNKYINNDSYPDSNYPYGYTYFTNATGRVCDGRIVPDFIAEYAKLPLIPASMQPGADFSYGANFASGGSAVLDSDGETDIKVINLKGQVLQFKEMVRKFSETLGPRGAGEMARKAVYLFSTGGNDYLHYYTEIVAKGRVPTQAEQQQFVEEIVGNITNEIVEIYQLGGRKIAYQNVAPMGCLPAIEKIYPKLNGSCASELLSMPMLHNQKLYEALTDLAERLEGFKFSVMDYFSSLYDRMMNPSKYGFRVGRTACYQRAKGYTRGDRTLCEYPSAYLFFDPYHTTQCANAQIAKLLWKGDPSVTRPYNVKQLFKEG